MKKATTKTTTASRSKKTARTSSAKTTKAPQAKTAATAAKGKTKASGRATTSKDATRAKSGGDKAGKRVGILDAAAQILAKAKQPMACKEIVEQAIAQNLWATSGQTPSATLYAAIIREISKKGKDARFEKVDRGRFQLRAPAPGTPGGKKGA